MCQKRSHGTFLKYASNLIASTTYPATTYPATTLALRQRSPLLLSLPPEPVFLFFFLPLHFHVILMIGSRENLEIVKYVP